MENSQLRDWKGANPQWEKAARRHAVKGVNKQMNLRKKQPLWATPRAEERSQYNSRDNHVALSRQAPLWPTPNVPNGGRKVSEQEMEDGKTLKGRKVQKPLARTAELWPSPPSDTG